MRREVSDAFEDRQREVRCGEFMREALADEPGDLRLVIERVQATDAAARAVSENEGRRRAFALFRERDDLREITDESDIFSTKSRSPPDFP